MPTTCHKLLEQKAHDSMLTASLPMYIIPEIRKASSSFWRGIAKYLRKEGIQGVPDELVDDKSLAELLSDKNLLFSQCCGYDVVGIYKDTLTPFATPEFDVEECCGYDYSSLIVVPDDSPFEDVLDMRGMIAVANGPGSHSGMSSLRHLVAPKNIDGMFFRQVIYSGSHVESMRLLRERQADVAAIDCVTYKLLQVYESDVLAGTRVLGRTFHAPAPPYVTLMNRDPESVEQIRTAVFRAFSDSDYAADRHALLLKDIEEVDISTYEKISDFEIYAAKLGYPELR